MLEMNYCAGIVTYNPQISRLQKNLNAISVQVENVIIVDNGSANTDEIKALVSQYKNVHINELNQNMGIAYALNIIYEYASTNNYEWFLTLDQDSICMPMLINKYNSLVRIDNVGIISCEYIDINSKLVSNVHKSSKDDYIDIPYCLTSGSFMNVEATKLIGGFDTKMFIDKVDLDISLSMKKHGFRIIKANYVGLLHELGEAKEYRSITGKKKYVFNHNPIRRYYIMRNAVYCCKKHKNYLAFRFLYSDLCSIVPVFLHEDQKFKKLWYEIKGLFIGLFI